MKKIVRFSLIIFCALYTLSGCTTSDPQEKQPLDVMLIHRLDSLAEGYVVLLQEYEGSVQAFSDVVAEFKDINNIGHVMPVAEKTFQIGDQMIACRSQIIDEVKKNNVFTFNLYLKQTHQDTVFAVKHLAKVTDRIDGLIPKFTHGQEISVKASQLTASLGNKAMELQGYEKVEGGYVDKEGFFYDQLSIKYVISGTEKGSGYFL